MFWCFLFICFGLFVFIFMGIFNKLLIIYIVFGVVEEIVNVLELKLFIIYFFR